MEAQGDENLKILVNSILLHDADHFCSIVCNEHCVKSARIRSFSGLYFPAFGLNTERYGVFLLIQSKCGKIRTSKSLNTDTFHAMEGFNFSYPLALVYTANRNHRYSCFDTHAKVCLNIFFINST